MEDRSQVPEVQSSSPQYYFKFLPQQSGVSYIYWDIVVSQKYIAWLVGRRCRHPRHTGRHIDRQILLSQYLRTMSAMCRHPRHTALHDGPGARGPVRSVLLRRKNLLVRTTLYCNLQSVNKVPAQHQTAYNLAYRHSTLN